jgi:hypothetical protein
MRLGEGSDVKGNGPSFEEAIAKDVRVSGAQLAALANVLPQDIRYWGRSGYLKGETQDEGAEDTSYKLTQLPKVQLMALFTKRLEIKAKKASELADDLLRLYANKPDALKATIGMVQLLESRIGAFVDLILEMDLLPRIGALLKEEP